MDAAELQRKIDHAFRNVARPTTFTTCHCEECLALDKLLQTRDHSTFAADDVDMSLCLLSPEGLTYWIPALVRVCLMHDRDSGCDVCDTFINSELGMPLPRDDFPHQHPKFAPLDPEQTSVLVNFLTYIEKKWYAEMAEETPRELARAIRNWKRFAGVPNEPKKP
jgi:hypothetical protein